MEKVYTKNVVNYSYGVNKKILTKTNFITEQAREIEWNEKSHLSLVYLIDALLKKTPSLSSNNSSWHLWSTPGHKHSHLNYFKEADAGNRIQI